MLLGLLKCRKRLTHSLSSNSSNLPTGKGN
jgi:hypothetical protein